MSTPPADLARTSLQLLVLGALIASSVWIVEPFLPALTWAIMIVVSTWPVLLHVQAWLGGSRRLAVTAMTIVLLLILVVPLYFGVAAVVENTDQIAEWSKSVAALAASHPPDWVAAIPWIGGTLAEWWQRLAAAGAEDVLVRLAPYGQTLVRWFVGQVGGVGLLLVQFLLTVIIAAILYANGERAARGADRLAWRLAGARGPNTVHLAAQAVRGVALGVVVTAIVQSGLAGIGLAIAGVPFVAVLTVLMFVLAVAQIGAGPVLLGAVVWVYTHHGGMWGTVFLVWAVLCGGLDNVLRPILIKRGADLPLLLIFAGVVGGLVAFGIIGLFIGPVVLAVAYTLLVDWVYEDGAATDD
ncbi:MAG: AI-2E family transporter YdiK [Deltaproteobacteria bacterium]|nr:AI-2E family transporter YdiK [Deltaproteobacteria bacterium]